MLYRAFFCLRPPHSQPHGTRFFFLRRSRACFAPTRALTHRAFFTLALLHSQPHAFMLHAKPPSQMRQPRVFFCLRPLVCFFNHANQTKPATPYFTPRFLRARRPPCHTPRVKSARLLRVFCEFCFFYFKFCANFEKYF